MGNNSSVGAGIKALSVFILILFFFVIGALFGVLIGYTSGYNNALSSISNTQIVQNNDELIVDACMNPNTHTYAYFKTEVNDYLGTVVTMIGSNGDLVIFNLIRGEVQQHYTIPMNLCRWEQKK